MVIVAVVTLCQMNSDNKSALLQVCLNYFVSSRSLFIIIVVVMTTLCALPGKAEREEFLCACQKYIAFGGLWSR